MRSGSAPDDPVGAADQHEPAGHDRTASIAGVSIITRPSLRRTNGSKRQDDPATRAGGGPRPVARRSTTIRPTVTAPQKALTQRSGKTSSMNVPVIPNKWITGPFTTNDPIGCRKNGSPNWLGSLPRATESASSA